MGASARIVEIKKRNKLKFLASKGLVFIILFFWYNRSVEKFIENINIILISWAVVSPFVLFFMRYSESIEEKRLYKKKKKIKEWILDIVTAFSIAFLIVIIGYVVLPMLLCAVNPGGCSFSSVWQGLF